LASQDEVVVSYGTGPKHCGSFLRATAPG